MLVSRKASSAGNQRIAGSRMACGSIGEVGMQRHYLLPSHIHFDNRHGVIAEDVHDLDGDLAPSGRAFMGDTGQLQRAILLGAEGLPFVLENIVAGPRLLPFAGIGILGADDLPLALKIEVTDQ